MTAERERDRAEVYSVLLDAQFDGAAPEQSVLAAETDDSDWVRSILERSAPSYDLWRSEAGEPVGEPQSVSLGARDSSLRYVSRADREQLFQRGMAGWPDFFVRYPGAKGLLTFSDVAFDPKGRRALVFAFRACGGRCGYGGVYALEETDGQWHVSEQLASVKS